MGILNWHQQQIFSFKNMAHRQTKVARSKDKTNLKAQAFRRLEFAEHVLENTKLLSDKQKDYHFYGRNI